MNVERLSGMVNLSNTLDNPEKRNITPKFILRDLLISHQAQFSYSKPGRRRFPTPAAPSDKMQDTLSIDPESSDL